MNKFGKWYEEHKVDLFIGGMSAVVIGVSTYIGYKLGANVGFVKGTRALPTQVLVDAGIWKADDLAGKQWHVTWLADKVAPVMCDELKQKVLDAGGDLAKTTVIAISGRDLPR